jgi:flagellar hook assembly protein FlgD
VAIVIAFDLPEVAGVRLTVYDTQGRILSGLTDAVYQPGRHALTWLGRDEAGNPVGPRVYFIRMQAGGFETMKKVMLLR